MESMKMRVRSDCDRGLAAEVKGKVEARLKVGRVQRRDSGCIG